MKGTMVYKVDLHHLWMVLEEADDAFWDKVDAVVGPGWSGLDHQIVSAQVQGGNLELTIDLESQ